MKIALTTLFAALFLFTIAGAPLLAQNAPAEAEVKERPAVPTPPVEDEGVRINGRGVHVGGRDGVDIEMPNWGSRLGSVLGPLIPIIAIVSVFGSPVAILGIIFYFRHRRNRMLHETLRAMIEKGVPIPPELISSGGTALANGANLARRASDLRNGLVLIGVGAGIMALGYQAGFSRLGLIPVFIGVAMIVAWLIGNRIKNKPSSQSSQ